MTTLACPSERRIRSIATSFLDTPLTRGADLRQPVGGICLVLRLVIDRHALQGYLSDYGRLCADRENHRRHHVPFGG